VALVALLALLSASAGPSAGPSDGAGREVFVFRDAPPIDRVEVERIWPADRPGGAERGTATLLLSDGTMHPLVVSRRRGPAGAVDRYDLRTMRRPGWPERPALVFSMRAVAGPGAGAARRVDARLDAAAGVAVRLTDASRVTLAFRPPPAVAPLHLAVLASRPGPDCRLDAGPLATFPDGSAVLAVRLSAGPAPGDRPPFPPAAPWWPRKGRNSRDACGFVRLSPDGDVLWTARLEAEELRDRPRIAAGPDGSFFVAVPCGGETALVGADGRRRSPGSAFEGGLVVACFDPEGDLSWVRYSPDWGPWVPARLRGILALAGGGAAVEGYCYGRLRFPPTVREYAEFVLEWAEEFIVGFAADGTIRGGRGCRLTSTSILEVDAMAPAGEESLLLAGPFREDLSFPGQPPLAPQHGTDAFVARVRATGETEWAIDTGAFRRGFGPPVVASSPEGETLVVFPTDTDPADGSGQSCAVLAFARLGPDGARLSVSSVGDALRTRVVGLLPLEGGRFVTVETTVPDALWPSTWISDAGGTRDLRLVLRERDGAEAGATVVASGLEWPLALEGASALPSLLLGVTFTDRLDLCAADPAAVTRLHALRGEDWGLLDHVLFRVDLSFP
jgi:hypothetical protein